MSEHSPQERRVTEAELRAQIAQDILSLSSQGILNPDFRAGMRHAARLIQPKGSE